MKYTKIKLVPLTTIGVMHNPELGGQATGRPDGLVTLIAQVDAETVVNELLTEGWEVIRFITHRSDKHDVTGIACMLGMPGTT